MPHPTPQGETISAHDRGEDLPIRMREPLEVETVSTDKTERAAFDSLCMWADEAATRLTSENHEVRDRLREAVQRARAAIPSQPATVVQTVIAWVHEDDARHSISAIQKEQALRDGGASASSVRPYSVAAYAHPSAPAESGWQWVPVEPTPEMMDAAWGNTPLNMDDMTDGDFGQAYKNMLKAAPSAAQPGGADGGAHG